MKRYQNIILKTICLTGMFVLSMPATFAQSSKADSSIKEKVIQKNKHDKSFHNFIKEMTLEVCDTYKTVNIQERHGNTSGSSPVTPITRASSTVIATTTTNLPLIQVARQQGWIASTATQMTEGDAARVTEIPESCFENNEEIKSFNEFQYFTSCKNIGVYAFFNCPNMTSIVLPKSIEKIGGASFAYTGLYSFTIPASVISIGHAFLAYCDNLATIESNASWLTIVNGALIANSNAIIAYPAKRTNTSFTVPSDVTAIRMAAFSDNTYLTNISFPSSLTSIEAYAFDSCTQLSSISLPSSLEEIGDCAYVSCSNLSSVYAYMPTPMAINEECFYPSYSTAILYVPAGKKSIYQSTNYWNQFQNITEIEAGPVNCEIDGITYLLKGSDATIISVGEQYDDVIIPERISYNGNYYSVTAIAEQALACNEGFNYSVSFPSTIKTIAAKAFDYAETSAIIWNSNTSLPTNAFANIEDTWKNMLLYVNKSSIAPSNFANTIVNGVAENIELKEGYVFHCPKEFTAKKISFTHEFIMNTVIGKRQGWETIALPFDVMTITHATKGQLVPFEIYSSTSSGKPFWLYEWTSSGFAKASSMQANKPYLISMPNNTEYSAAYNLAGVVTFSATNSVVKTTKDEDILSYGFNNKYFFPSYYFQSTSNTYANASINSVNNLHSKDGGYDPGSIFINNKNLRNTFPFEAFIEDRTSNANARRVFEIEFAPDNETEYTGILSTTAEKDVKGVYTLSGIRIDVDETLTKDEIVRQLPSGVYIINGKKKVVK